MGVSALSMSLPYEPAIREYCEDVWKVQPMAIAFTD
jgi:hypothetical protein